MQKELSTLKCVSSKYNFLGLRTASLHSG